MEWSNEVILEFLGLYENEPTIWDRKHPSYKNRYEVSVAWRRIEENLSIQCSVYDLKKKRESLMATFRQIFNKIKQSERAGIDYKPNWFAYETMERFLKSTYQPRTSFHSDEYDYVPEVDIEQSENLIEGVNIKIEDMDNIEHEIQVDNKGLNKNLEQNEQNFPEDTIEINPAETIRDPPLNGSTQKTKEDYTNPSHCSSRLKRNFMAPMNAIPKRRKRDSFEYEMEKRVVQAYRVMTDMAKKCPKDDCSLYGELIGRKLRKLDERTREIVMNQIDNIVFRAKMGQYAQASTVQSPFPSPTISIHTSENSSFSQPSPERHEPVQSADTLIKNFDNQ